MTSTADTPDLGRAPVVADGLSAVRLLDEVVSAMGGTARPGQQQMAAEVAQTIEQGGTVLIQAGTGTGKSMGYVVPALAHAVETSTHVVVSTATLALQRQLVTRDLPTAVAALTPRLTRAPVFALLKGWHNYVCLHKTNGGYPVDDPGMTLFDVESAQDHPAQAGPASGPSDLGQEVVRVREWAEQSTSGDRDDLVPGVSERAWRQVSVTSLECLGQRCPMLTECFPERARAAARAADLVVTNHAMLGIAAAGNSGVLPEHQVVVVDEAHELVSRVTSAAAVELSVRAVEAVSRRARREGATGIARLDAALTDLASALAAVPAGRLESGAPEPLAGALAGIRDAARDLISSLKPSEEAASPSRRVAQAAATELFAVAERMAGHDPARDVLWAQRGQQDTTATLHAAPLDVAGQIKGSVLGVRSAILTSATLALGGSFESMAHELGLWSAPQEPGAHLTVAPAEQPASQRWRGLAVSSPFDYAAQGILYVEPRLPRPGREGTPAEHLDLLAELMAAAGGRTLGLFSSRRAAQAAAGTLRGRVSTPILCQGDGQLAELIEQFAADPATSLFGTLSLWQGVDVPGTSCQLVVIDRIPFPRPDDPVMSARSDLANARGGNGFMQVSATHAALLLAQGAGRLVRSVQDRGVVAVLDSRLVTARYGSFLRATLPGFWQTTSREVATDALRRLRALG